VSVWRAEGSSSIYLRDGGPGDGGDTERSAETADERRKGGRGGVKEGVCPTLTGGGKSSMTGGTVSRPVVGNWEGEEDGGWGGWERENPQKSRKEYGLPGRMSQGNVGR